MAERHPTAFAYCPDCRTLYVGCQGEGRFCSHHDTRAPPWGEPEVDPRTLPKRYLEHQWARHVVDCGAVETMYRDLFWKLRDQLHRLTEDWMSDPNKAKTRGDQ